MIVSLFCSHQLCPTQKPMFDCVPHQPTSTRGANQTQGMGPIQGTGLIRGMAHIRGTNQTQDVGPIPDMGLIQGRVFRDVF